MLHHVQAIANEFDSYLQDRAQRLGYRVRSVAPGDACAITPAGRFALVEFAGAPADAGSLDFSTHGAMQACHDGSHFMAWADFIGALVQVNVCRHEIAGGAGRTGVRTFAEQFFGGQHGRSLPFDAFSTYLDWLAAAPRDVQPPLLALLMLAPDARELVLVRLPSVAAARGWLRANG